MDTFQTIVADAAKTAHKVYHYLAPNGETYSTPRPAKQESGKKQLQRLRVAEQKERAKKLAELVHAAGIDKCEEFGASIAELIDPPVHISMADGSLPVMVSLLRRIEGEN